MGFFRRLKLFVGRLILGSRDDSTVPLPADLNYPQPDPELMEFLVKIYTQHGAVARRMGNWVSVDNGRIFTRAAHFNHRQHPHNLVLQTDFITVTQTGQCIVESFAGIGVDVSSAVLETCMSFMDSTFHALFISLLGRSCEHVERENWLIAEQPRIMTFGFLRIRGDFPLDHWTTLFEKIKEQMEATPLSRGLHWGRYFYSNIPGDQPIVEVLMDNEMHEELREQAAILPWPKTEEFYSARVFFVIQDADTSVSD